MIHRLCSCPVAVLTACVWIGGQTAVADPMQLGGGNFYDVVAQDATWFDAHDTAASMTRIKKGTKLGSESDLLSSAPFQLPDPFPITRPIERRPDSCGLQTISWSSWS